MAIYHCSIKIISRGKGKSAVAASAYRSGTCMKNHYDGITHNFTKKSGIVYSEIFLPEHAPPEYLDRAVLWNEVETIEKNKNSQLAREIEVALPIELNQEQHQTLIQSYVKETFVSAGMCADVAIHDKGDGNPHAHILLTMRPIEPDGTWGAKSKKEYILDKDGEKILLKSGAYKSWKINTVDWNDREKAEVWRKGWADCVNSSLAVQDIPQRVDHRSYKRQGIEQIPTIHLGVAVTQMEQRGMVTELGEKNRNIKKKNRLLKELERRIATLTNWLKANVPFLESQNLIELITDFLQKQAKGISGSQADGEEDYAKAVCYLQKNNISTMQELQEKAKSMKKEYWTSKKEIKHTETQLHKQTELIGYAEKYLQYRSFHVTYQQTKPEMKREYYDRHTRELILYDSAQRYLKKQLGKEAGLKLNTWKTEAANLQNKKDQAYQKMKFLKTEVEEIEFVLKRVEQVIQAPKPEQGKRMENEYIL